MKVRLGHAGLAVAIAALMTVMPSAQGGAPQDGWTVERAQAEAEAIGLQNPQLKEFAVNYIKEHPAKK